MKTFLHKSPKMILALVGLASVWGLFGTANAQTHKERTYADFQGTSETGVNVPLVGLLVGNVANPTNAISASIRDSSTLSYTVSALGVVGAGQFLEFTTDGTTPRTITAGTPIYVKIGLPASLVGLLDNLSIGTFTNLHTVPATLTQKAGYAATTTAVYTSANIVSALNGSGTVELKIVPTVNANGVYIQLSTVLGVASSANVFHAFILEDQPGAAGCPTGIDWLSGSNATLGLALASATGTVANPQLAIDNDLNTAATFSTGVQAASLPYFTSILNTNAKSGDSVRVIIDNPNGGLLNIGLLTSFQIQAFNDNTPVGTPIVNDPALLKIQLLPGATNKNIITAAIPGDFNRIQISMGGVADLSSLLGNGTLNIYDISVKVPAPVIDAATQADQYAYVGSTVTLHAATNATGDPIVWFTDSLGTTPVSTINTSASGVQTFYARSSRDGCTDASGVASVKLHISAISNPALPAGNVGQAYSQVVTADIVAPSDLPNTPVYSFTYASHTFNPVVMGSSPISNIANRYAMIDMPSVFSAGPMNLGTADMFASIDLGNGLFYNDVTNTIEGTPTTEGTYNVTFNVTDDANGGISAGQITKTFAIAAALPVHLGDFNVHLDNNKNAVLNWETASEQNTVRFDVMRSSNGTNFTKIKSVEAAGISTTPKSYSYTDNNPGAKSYYRIDIILTNEATSNSKVISISGGRSSGFAINPNPASDKIVITGINSDDIATVSIYDASGRLVQTATNGTINVQALSHGVYFVTVAQKDGTKSNGKFLKK